MIQRGLIIASSGTFLTCVHCHKQIHDFGECLKHFTEYKNRHLKEKPSLDDLADNIKRNESDETTDGSSVLERYFG